MQKQPFQNTSECNVIIVGAGCIGLSTAYKLAKHGKKVTIIEKGRIGKQASWASAGMLQPITEDWGSESFLKLCLRSHAKYRSFLKELVNDSGIDVELNTRGSLLVAFDKEEQQLLRKKQRLAKKHNITTTWHSKRSLKELEPALSDDIICALHVPIDYQLNNRLLIASLLQACRRYGVRIVEDCEVTQIMDTEPTVYTRKRAYYADIVINCSGAWASKTSGAQVKPIKGHMLRYIKDSLPLKHIIVSHPYYAVPKKDGTIVFGSTMEDVGFDDAIHKESIDFLKERAQHIIPDLTYKQIAEQWIGFRPLAQDRMPIIGRESKTHYIATGHFRNGILLTPITAEILTKKILEQ